MRMPQEFDTRGGNPQRTSKNECPDGVRSNDDRNQSKKRIIDKSPAIDGNLVETKNKGNQGCQNCMESKERREGNENPKRKSKRRSLRWIIQREQTAKGGTKHKKSFESRVLSFELEIKNSKLETRNTELYLKLFKASASSS